MNIALDMEDSPDPSKSVRKIIGEILAALLNTYPLPF